jgi:hypothetical protein
MDRHQFLADLSVGRRPVNPVTDAAEWDTLVTLAIEERIAPLLGRQIERGVITDIPNPARDRLLAQHQEAAYAGLLHDSIRNRVCRSLREGAVPVMLLKGAALAASCYEDPATRLMSDLDVLVPRASIRHAVALLEREEFRLTASSLDAALRSPRGHAVMKHRSLRSVVEVHWELKVLGRAQRSAIAGIWAEACSLPSAVDAVVMRPGHLLPMLCAHMALQHQDGCLIWLHDLHRVLLTADATESRVSREAATRWRLAPCMALCILRAQRLFGTPLPAEMRDWCEVTAARDTLQGRLTALALTPGGSEAPSADLADLMMARDWSILRVLFPGAAALRRRYGLGPGESVLPAYLALWRRQLRHGPAYLGQFWRCWSKAAPGSRGAAPSPRSARAGTRLRARVPPPGLKRPGREPREARREA